MSDWPAWFYGPGGEARIFQRREDVPDGWGDAPKPAPLHGNARHKPAARKGRS